ncbi:MAG: VIT domain-containing protein, partial [Myxococcota bacterium]
MAIGSRALFLRAVLALLVLLLVTSCGSNTESLAPRTQTFGEVRTIRGIVSVVPPDGDKRPIMPRERLVDGSGVEVPNHALAWLRRDGGTTLLVSGPANLVFGADNVTIKQGRVFVDSPGDAVTSIRTPEGMLRLVRVRASLEVTEGKATEAYVLSGEVRTDAGVQARPGERLTLAKGDGKPTVQPAIAWVDWTGGLATTDRGAEPPPFGVGTVGARPAGDKGAPRAPLSIRRMDVRVTIKGDLATTEVDQAFFNGASETVEGIYTFRTPSHAALTRF